MVTNSNLSTAWPLFLSLLVVQGFPLCQICPVDEHIALTWWCTSHNTLATAQNTYSQSSKARESSQSRCPFLSLWNTNSLSTMVSHMGSHGCHMTVLHWISHISWSIYIPSCQLVPSLPHFQADPGSLSALELPATPSNLWVLDHPAHTRAPIIYLSKCPNWTHSCLLRVNLWFHAFLAVLVLPLHPIGEHALQTRAGHATNNFYNLDTMHKKHSRKADIKLVVLKFIICIITFSTVEVITVCNHTFVGWYASTRYLTVKLLEI